MLPSNPCFSRRQVTELQRREKRELEWELCICEHELEHEHEHEDELKLTATATTTATERLKRPGVWARRGSWSCQRLPNGPSGTYTSSSVL